HTTRDGELVNLSGAFVPDPGAAAERGRPGTAVQTIAPLITPRAAIKAAAENVGVVVSETEILPRSEPGVDPELRQRFFAAALSEETLASLVWLPMEARELRLVWEVIFTSRSRGEMFRTLVDANTGEVLVRRCLTEYISNASFRVYTSDSPTAFSPGHSSPLSTQPVAATRSLVTLGALNTNASPNGWINDGGNETVGNNVDAHTDRNNDDMADLPRPQGSPFRTFDFAMDPTTQAPTSYSNAAVVQLFYLCNWMHDRLYELGFTESAGNFQSDNFGRGGFGSDAVQADAQDGGGFNNANFSTPPDGFAGRMQMYLFDGPTPDRDGDFDAEIVLHEYAHGLSNRRVGGGVGLSAMQSRGMGEGWSDFYGMALLSEAGDDVIGCYAAGGYATYQLSGLTQNYYYGIRRYPYSTDMSKNPLTFRDIDPAQASTHAGVPRSPIIGSTADEVHNMGEVWCVALWEARANLIAKHGWAVGNQLILQLVTDGMNLSPANPNFLQARDAILQADLVNNGGANRTELWQAFARRGMGVGATSPASSTTVGLQEAFDVPDALLISPAILTSAGPVGGPFSPNSASFTLTNTGSNALTWNVASGSSWLIVSPVGGTLNVGAGTSVSVVISDVATNFPLGTATGLVREPDKPRGIYQSRTFTLNVVGRTLFDDFEPGIHLSLWSAFGGTPGLTVLATNYGGSVSGAKALWLGDAGIRSATTIPVNTSAGGSLSFYLRLANGGGEPWENVDIPNEGIVLEYSTNGAVWTIMGNYDTPTFYNWTLITTNLPAGALAATTQFRWRQLSHSGTCCDHWALDDVSIDAGPTPPTISQQPQSQLAAVGEPVSLNVVARGSLPLNFQWRRDGTNLAGATNGLLALANVQLSDAGIYSVILSNNLGTLLSSNAVLTVIPTPPCVTAPTNLVSWWKAEANLIDQAGIGHGTFVGNAAYGPGRVGQCLVMDGSGDAVAVGNPINLRFQDFTIEAWIRRTSTSIASLTMGGGMIFGYGAGGYALGMLDSGALFLSKTGFDSIAPGAVITDTNWHHVAVTKSGSAVVFYIDTVAYVVPSYFSIFAFTTPAAVGARGDTLSNSFMGNLDEVSVYSRPLAASEIQAVYEARASGKCVTPMPPFVVAPPASRIAGVSNTVTFEVVCGGSLPLSFQWTFNGTNLSGGTNSILTLADVQTNQAGAYAAWVMNPYGSVTSSVANLTVIVLGPGEDFQITGLFTNNSQIVDHDGLTSDDRGGIAASAGHVFYSGDFSTARFSLTNLSGGTSLGQIYDSLVSDLQTEQIYALGNGADILGNGGGIVTTLIPLNGVTLQPGVPIPLTEPITLFGGSGIFAGYGRVVLWNGSRAYDIRTHSGFVFDLGAMALPNHANTESWAFWGVAESAANVVSLVYVRDSQTIARTRVPDGVTTVLASFSNLSDMACITVSPLLNRWYFHHESGSQFGGSIETIGYAEASFAFSLTNPPGIITHPLSRAVKSGTNVSFTVLAQSTSPLSYQWRKNGTNLFDDGRIGGA
ncbi:MAG: M36 family metallopeptidase, partial [Akkermansiaceae bacterium]|nr:M36 family metallopeptidase [Verrucomicrobiales bacterium]